MEYKTKRFVFKCDSDYNITFENIKEEENYLKLKIRVKFGEKIIPDKTAISFAFPICDIFSYFAPDQRFNHGLEAYWNGNSTTSRSASWMPVASYLSLSGENRVTVALSDVSTPVEFYSGVVEETAEILFKIILFKQKISAISEYETELLIDTRRIPFYECVKDVRAYWEKNGLKSASFPDEAKRPMYSTWYSYHQKLEREELLKELKLAKEYYMDTVIIDDGWQTDDNNRGYAFCGDWEPIKIPDMKGLVSDIHKIGMKCILWYSVPYVGIHSKAWSKFQGKFLNMYGEGKWASLDIRYKCVRDYLGEIYENAVKDWNLDGLKLDFIDSFSLTNETASVNDEMDFESLEDAIYALLKEVKERLVKINPDIMIEFRQSYAGPVMCSYGNMLRVADCPNNSLKNRVDSINLRLTSGKTPVHSDMLMWNEIDSVECAALQIINVMFAVPQISVLIEKISCEQRRMLKFYMRLWSEYRDCLMSENIVAKNPEANYSLVYSAFNDTIFAVSYSTNILKINEEYDEIIFVNGSWSSELLLENQNSGFDADILITDCMGNVSSCFKETVNTGYNVYKVPNSGILKIKNIRRK